MYEKNMNWERLAVYATLGVLLDTLEQGVSTWGFWCMLALFVLSDYLGRKAGYEDGVVHGMITYINANEQQRQDLDKIVKEHND